MLVLKNHLYAKWAVFPYPVTCIRLITQVSVRYGEIIHEPTASEIMYSNTSCATNVIRDLFVNPTY